MPLPRPNTAFAPAPHRRPGGNTQAKLDLWRTQGNVEPSHGPPAPLRRGVADGLLGTDERRVRLWEKVDAEELCLRRFRNPVIESLGRVNARARAPASQARKRSTDASALRASHAPADASASFARGGDGAAERESGRPPSRGLRRSVRFETVDEGARVEGSASDGDEGRGSLNDLLRRMWDGVALAGGPGVSVSAGVPWRLLRG